MRQLGTLHDKTSAHLLVAYLLKQEIDSKLTSESETDSETCDWTIWIHSEDDLPAAKNIWEAFVRDPTAAPFSDIQIQIESPALDTDRIDDDGSQSSSESSPEKESSELADGDNESTRADSASPYERANPIFIDLEGTRVTLSLIALSVFASLISHFGTPRGLRDSNEITIEQNTYRSLSFVNAEEYEATGDPFISIKQGQVWRIFTPFMLHADALHLSFNMLWLFFFGSAIERLEGSRLLFLLILVTQTVGVFSQITLPQESTLIPSLQGNPLSLGASGAVYGLFGYLWFRPIFQREYPIFLVKSNYLLMLGWLMFCFTPTSGMIVSGAHLGGLVSGIVLSKVVSTPKTVD